MKEYFAHETAVLDEGCQIGKNSKIWHFAHVMSGAVIGQNCVIGQNVMIANRVTLGNGVKVQNKRKPCYRWVARFSFFRLRL